MSVLEKVKELREITGAGMQDCKNALKENDNDVEKSIDYLRKKGVLKAAKKSSRDGKYERFLHSSHVITNYSLTQID